MSSFHLRLDLPKDLLLSGFSTKFLRIAETILARYTPTHLNIFDLIILIIPRKKVKQSHYRPGQAQRVARG